MDGWIKLYKKIADGPDWLSEPFTKAQAWVDLLLLANYKVGHIRKRGILVEIQRGEVGLSQRSLAERWKWSRGKVLRFLDELKTRQQIDTTTVPQNPHLSGLIIIINYDKYQTDGTTDGTTDGPQTGHKQYQTKNNKNNILDNNIYILPQTSGNNSDFKFKQKVSIPKNIHFTERMADYAKKQGCQSRKYAEDLFEDFCNHHGKTGKKWQDWTLAFYTWVRNDKKRFNPDRYAMKEYIE